MAARLRDGPQSAPPEHFLFVPEAEFERLGPAAQRLLETAIALHRTGRAHGALNALRGLVRLAAESAWGHALLGMVLAETGDARGSREAFARALALEPGMVQALTRAGVEAFPLDLQRALSIFTLATTLAPDAWRVKSHLAHVRYVRGDRQGALALLDAAWRASGRDGLRLKRVIMLIEPIYASMEHLQGIRNEYLAGLAELAATPLRIDDPLDDVGLTNFLLAYQGRNERDSQAQLAGILLRANPALGYVAPHPRAAAPSRARPRVGMLSTYFGRKHSVGAAYDGLLDELARIGTLELTVICLQEEGAARLRERLGGSAAAVALPGESLEAARRALAALELDVLLYADIGMDPFTYYLAFGRYARLQGVIAGHPLTSGIPAIDVFISGDHAEPADAESHYSERLVRLSRVPVGMRAPALPPPRSRAELGLPETGNLYVCPMKLQKFHPEFDAALAGILRADPEAEIVLFADFNTDIWDQRVQQRLERALGEHAHRATFLPWQPSEAFLAILMHADVALDTFHFGAGTTCALVFGAGCPMLTLPAAFMRGRLTYSYYRIMEIDECIATDAGDYVRRAVSIARDRPLRARLGEQIRTRSARLFDAAPVAAELATALLALHREQPVRGA